ncbi:hypothetical protein SO802_009456 [Lithocarpus litseifolius]|uniref:SWIM-type domain-containing protein n=1 Tax=Lithocarpus litseifolius TaxID=425828 RepID=A0AAW2DCT9_9ROSI
MADEEVKLEVHYGGTFLWNPRLEYFGGKVEIVCRDIDRLSYFEIKGICEELGIDEPCRVHYLGPGGNFEQDLRLIEDDKDVVPMCKLNVGGSRDTIILYVESGHTPLAVEVPDGAGVGAGGGAGAATGGGARGGAGAATGDDASVGIEEEFDWLNEGLEGEDFADDIFGESSPPHNVPFNPNTVPTTDTPQPTTDTHQPTTDTPHPNNNTPQPNTNTPQPNTDTLGPSNVPPNINLDEEWAEPALEDDIASVDGSDDEQGPRNLEFNERTDMENVRLVVRMKFPNSKVFRQALREYVIQHHIDIKWKLNEKKKISVHCKNNCGWRCYASMVSGEGTFEIKTLKPECTCPLTFRNRSRKAARGLITRNEEAQYGLLRDYAEMIRRTDVGSKVILQTEMENENAEPKFKRMYIRYNAQKVGFLGGCRPFVGLDGCHLKGRFGGQLLSTTAKDGNDNIFPVAMAVVEQENKDSWTWFLEQFADDIGRPEELNLVFISDRQKGLLPAMETLFPTVEHRYCVKHIYNNFKVNHKGMELKSVLWRCASTTSVREFERGMEHLKSLDEEAWKYLADIEPAQWTRSHFSPRALIDCLANNLSESFNSMILKARDKPILSMLEWITVRLMSRLYVKKIGIEKYGGRLCPSIQGKLEKLKLESKSFCAMPSGRFVYEVASERERYVVDLVGRTCSCRAWDLTGIPCKHGVAAIFVNREMPEDYTHPCYYKDAYVETYKTPIPPMPGQSEWVSSGQPKPVVSIIYKPPGRPPMKRKRNADEPRNPYKVSRANKLVRCGRCQKEGHNARGCKANVTGETPWERRKRLQKEQFPYTMGSSSSNQTAGSQPPATQPPATQPPAQTPWSQQPSQWYSSDFKYTVRGAPWFTSSQPAPHTPAETWDSRPPATRSPATRSPATRSPATRGVALRGRGNAARTQKCRTRGGKANSGGRGRARGSK